MRTRNMLTSNEVLKTQEKPLAKAVRDTLKSYETKADNLFTKDFQSYLRDTYGGQLLSITNINLTTEEESTYKLMLMFGKSREEAFELIGQDRINEAILNWLMNSPLEVVFFSDSASAEAEAVNKKYGITAAMLPKKA